MEATSTSPTSCASPPSPTKPRRAHLPPGVRRRRGSREAFTFSTGQFGLYSAFGEGESTFCIASSPTRKGYIECTFRETGRVTSSLADKDVGDIIGFRGPYGNVFPLEKWKGKNLVFVAGGIALPPLRSVIWNCLDLRDWFKDITVVYGARGVNDLVYKHELEDWGKRPT
jgi:sulfhydrogenase subunit gamma (sulfur reductase)